MSNNLNLYTILETPYTKNFSNITKSYFECIEKDFELQQFFDSIFIDFYKPFEILGGYIVKKNKLIYYRTSIFYYVLKDENLKIFNSKKISNIVISYNQNILFEKKHFYIPSQDLAQIEISGDFKCIDQNQNYDWEE